MREKPFTQFRQTKGGGKRGQGKWQETQRILERQSVRRKGEYFDAHSHQSFHLAMMGVHVLKKKHGIVPFEVVEQDDHVSVVAILVHGQPLHVLYERMGAFVPVMEMARVRFRRLVSDEHGCLHAFCIRHGLVVRVHEQRWFPFHLHESVLHLAHRGMTPDAVGGHLFRARFVVALRDGLDETLVRLDAHALFAHAAVGRAFCHSNGKPLVYVFTLESISQN